MKKKFLLLTISLSALLLSSCTLAMPIRIVIDKSSSSSIVPQPPISTGGTSANTSTTTPTSVDSSTETSNNTSSTPTSGGQTSSSTATSVEPTLTSNNTSVDTSNLTTINISYSNFSISDSYDTGNYGSTSVNGKTFSYYRARSGSSMVDLLPYYNNKNDGTAPGSISNKTGYSCIKKMVVSYSNDSSSSSTSGIKVSYGISYPLTSYQTGALSSSTATLTIEDAVGFSYFTVETTGYDLTIKSITLYNQDGATPELKYSGSGDGQYRINSDLKSSPSAGDTVTVPTAIQRNGDKYSVVSSKQYTYIPLSSLSSSSGGGGGWGGDDWGGGGWYSRSYTTSEAMLTDPFDVASYYASFGTWPANYYKDNKSSVSSVFGSTSYSTIHQVSFYTRTDGYVTALPKLLENSNFTYSGYYELDIYLGDNSRGVGRLIVFVDGLEGIVDGYKNSLIVYTDDHYATFQEYLGYGFGPRFDAEQFKTAVQWSASTTLTKE